MAKCIPNKVSKNISFTAKKVNANINFLPKKVNKDLCVEAIQDNTVFDYTLNFSLS